MTLAQGVLPLVSIVTPTLNQSEYLMQTVASVRAQNYPLIEYIIVDGGSTDGTIEKLHQLDSDPRVKWTSRPDHGMYQAVNSGLRNAQGQIVTYLNSDDLLVPWAVERVVHEFSRRPETDLVYGDALRLYQELAAYDLILQVPFHFAIASRTGSFVQPAVFWRRSLLKRIGMFDEGLRLSADLDYWLRASRVTRPVHVDEVLAIERAHSSSQTARVTGRLRSEATDVRSRYQNDVRLRRLWKLVARIALEVLVRVQMIRFLWVTLSGRQGWESLRGAASPRIRPLPFLLAMVTPRPLVGTPARSLRMGLLRGRWLHLRRPIAVGLEVVRDRVTG